MAKILILLSKCGIMINATRLILLLLFLGLMNSCDSVTDCIINTRPHLPHKDLKTGVDGVYYEDIIRAEIRNEPRDRDYWYYFTVSGLPSGLDYEFIGQDLFIYGTPQSTGRYSVEVFLEVEPRFLSFDDGDDFTEDGDSLCSYTDERFFSLFIR